MTRLTEVMLRAVNLGSFDKEVQCKTGRTLGQLAAEVAGLPEPLPTRRQRLFAVMPVSAGQGIVNGFVEQVAAVLAYLGLTVKKIAEPDVAGLAQAALAGADIVFCADDSLFMALNLKNGTCIDNATATAEMYVHAIALMANGMSAKKTLLLGLGKVGEACLVASLNRGSDLWVYDLSAEKTRQKAREYGVIPVEQMLAHVCREAEIIIDASPGGGFIPENWLSDGVVIAAPGLPLGLQAQHLSRFQDRMIHDCLVLGVAGMAAMSLAQGCPE